MWRCFHLVRHETIPFGHPKAQLKHIETLQCPSGSPVWVEVALTWWGGVHRPALVGRGGGRLRLAGMPGLQPPSWGGWWFACPRCRLPSALDAPTPEGSSSPPLMEPSTNNEAVCFGQYEQYGNTPTHNVVLIACDQFLRTCHHWACSVILKMVNL